MRFIAIGDRSRYQFLREIADGFQDTGQLESYRSEWLGQRLAEARNGSGCLNREVEKVVIESTKIPLHTSVFFPKEGEDGCTEYKHGDRIIIFDEFPFKKGSSMDLIERIRDRGRLSCAEVVLYCNNRTLLDTDVTTQENAIETAYREYQDLGVSASIYRPGEPKKFLLWKFGNIRSSFAEDMKERIRELRKNLKMAFELEFELMYEFELKELLENPAVLEKIVKYREHFHEGFIAEHYYKTAYHYYFVTKRSDLFNPIWSLYEKMIGTVAVWDMNRDRKLLESGIETLFHEKLCHISDLVFCGNSREYAYFLNNTHVELEFKQKMIGLFHLDLAVFLLEYMDCKINKVEELLNEAL